MGREPQFDFIMLLRIFCPSRLSKHFDEVLLSCEVELGFIFIQVESEGESVRPPQRRSGDGHQQVNSDNTEHTTYVGQSNVA